MDEETFLGYWNETEYFNDLSEEIDYCYKIAGIAKKKNVDPSNFVESPVAKSVAERCVNLVKTIYNNLPLKSISDRIIKLETQYGKQDPTVAFVIAKEIAENQFINFESQKDSIDAGLRVGFAYLTLGVVASPIEGYTGLEIVKDDDRGFFNIKFSGPIRSAGTTTTCVFLMLVDYLREYFGYKKYIASQDEINRYFVECCDYNNKVSNLQYFPTEEEIKFLVKEIPIQIDGDPTENLEVSDFKDLPRVSTNKIRGGVCLVLAEALAQKALKGLQRLSKVKKNGIICSGFDYLSEYSLIHSKNISGDSGEAVYIKDLVAGRPVYGYPSRSGSFRFRYGKSRDSGFSCVGISPATMSVSDGFLSFGTQLKIEKPIKGAVITSCDTIDGPIVKLKDGSVKKIYTFDEGKNIFNNISEIIYLGDILVSLGDVVDRNSNLLKSAYVEEWWDLEVKEKMDILNEFMEYDKYDICLDDAIKISKKYLVPLHPKFIYYWSEISVPEFKELLLWLKDGHFVENKFILLWGQITKEKYSVAKRTLEILGVPHDVVFDNVVINEEIAKSLLLNIGISENLEKISDIINYLDKKENVLEIINNFSDYEIRDKSGEFVGARMGRPEKVKLRKQVGGTNTIANNDYLENPENLEKLKEFLINNNKDEGIIKLIKGIKDYNNDFCEDSRKGVLRLLNGLTVNKDGTIRYDGTEIPLTHFKPVEIGTSIEKLKELGYNYDIYGNELLNEEQILEIRPHDVVLSSFNNELEKSANSIFYNITKFLDNELEEIYLENKFYDLKSEEDLIGQLVVCMAPHNCAGVIGRIIGFSQMQGILASPYMHAAVRRDCDGDEISVMMLMDVLLNFSRNYLPKHRGGTQDAPLILNGRIFPGEVDDQILEYDIAWHYNLDLYTKSQNKEHSSVVMNDDVKNRLKNNISALSGIGFTHGTNDINNGEKNGSYKVLKTMKEKVEKQMELVDKIRAVDKDDVARMIVEKHFLKDILGNLTNFFRQEFRCSKCNIKYRRIPLTGTCRKCGNPLLMTVSYASIKKYLDSAIALSKKYNVSEYTIECVNQAKKYIEDIFGSEKQLELLKEELPKQEIKEQIIEEEVEEPKINIKINKDDVNFVHLHLHTEFSFLDGSIKINNKFKKNPKIDEKYQNYLFKRIKELGMDSVAITEHGNMESLVNKYQAAKEEGIKLIFGMEAYLVNDMKVNDKTEKRTHLILLAKNNEGLKNLLKLSSIGACEGFYYKPRIDKKVLKQYSEGLICTSACLANDIAQSIVNDNFDLAKEKIQEYLDIFGKENFFLEVQNHNIPEEKKVRNTYYKWADEMGIGLVATCDSHYLMKEDARAHEAMLCIQTNGFLDDVNHFQFNGDGYHVMSKEEMIERFPDRIDALNNTKKISDMCNVELELGKTTFPDYITPDGYTHDEYITELCNESLEKVYGEKENYEIAKQRMEYELSVIKKMGFSTYFLIVRDFITAAKSKCQVGPGRGSGAGSIVAYLLGITQLEPLHLGLLFERFLNPDRISLPDFDVDFGDRDVVIDYVKQKYGEDRIALIGTYGTMSAKSILKDVMRVFKIPFNVANKITDYVNEDTIKESLDASKELVDFQRQYSEVFDIAMTLEGGVRHKGVHACGVVWGKEPITNYLPVMERDGFIVAQAEGHEIEDLGLVKFDFLGLETLNITKKVLDFIDKNDEWLENIPLDDPNVYSMLAKGDSVGVFQLESGGMQKTLKSINPTCFDDIIAIVSLYRPGPMQYLEVYANRKSGKENIIYPHELAKEILAPTYGIMVYQEQVMQLAQKLAGFSMSEADTLRKAIGKKKIELMKSMEEKFKNGCATVAKMSKADIDKLWDDIVKFASYSFNKSHAAAYALIAYRTAYLKKYYPVEFMTATISSSIKDPDKMSFYLEEAKKMKINILGPDINTSLKSFNVEQLGKKKIIRFGLSGIKNVGDGAIDSIIGNRSYNSFDDFLNKVDLTKVNKRVIKNLICVGCFDNFGINRGDLLAIQENGNKKSNKQATLFEAPVVEKVVSNKMSLKDMISYENELIGVCISGNPVDLFVESKSASLNEYNLVDSESISLFGIIKRFRKTKTKSGDNMAFLTIANKNKSCDCVIFPRTYEEFFQTVSNIQEDEGFVVSGTYKENKENGGSLIINDINKARMVDTKTL